MDPTRIQIFRNCGFGLSIPMLDAEGYPLPLTGYHFAFAIASVPVPPTGAFGLQVLSRAFPGSGSGAVTYALVAEETAQLEIGIAYQYSALGQAPGAEPAVLQYGSIHLVDAPAMTAQVEPYYKEI